MIDREADSGDYEDANNADEEQPSLGFLDEALQFIATEHTKLVVPRDMFWQRGNSSTSDNPLHRQQLPHQHQYKQLTPW